MQPFFPVTLIILLGTLTPVQSCPQRNCIELESCLKHSNGHPSVEDYAYYERNCKSRSFSKPFHSPLFPHPEARSEYDMIKDKKKDEKDKELGK